jgi:DNA-binding NarL/FixJ family response regulator
MRPDVCLVDVRIAGGSTTVLEQVADELPATRIVLLTDANDETDLLAALKAGAAGSLPKDIEPRRLPIALRAVLAGEAAVPRHQVYRLIEELRRQRRSGRSLSASGQEVNLTRRELEVLENLAKDRTTAEIAERLGTSAGTVRSHIHALRQKLGVEPRTVAADVLSGESLRESTLLADLATRRRDSASARGSKLRSGTLPGP